MSAADAGGNVMRGRVLALSSRGNLVATPADFRAAIDYLFERYYDRGRIARPSDCRDLLEIVVSICRFNGEKPHLTRELIEESARQFIAEF